jgi:ketosteroid isomerase-like protein
MSDQEHPNIAKFRDGMRAFAERDLEGMRASYSDDLLWHYVGAAPIAGDYRGPDEVLAMFAHRAAIAGESWTSIVESVAASDDFITAIHRVRAERDGFVLDTEVCTLFWLRGGKVVEAWLVVGDPVGEARIYG